VHVLRHRLVLDERERPAAAGDVEAALVAVVDA
jgi:hypothetical protein